MDEVERPRAVHDAHQIRPPPSGECTTVSSTGVIGIRSDTVS